jgi:hypothetical protein
MAGSLDITTGMAQLGWGRLLINDVTGHAKSSQKHLSGYATNQELRFLAASNMTDRRVAVPLFL